MPDWKRCEHGRDADYCGQCNLICNPQYGEWYCDEKDAALTAAQARIEKLERMVVWTAQESPCCCKLCTGDGTPASILAAVEKAMQS